jgi:NAD(P)-dependent dehydrogenase (short-subunit alcohol dehydrogenase family)
MRCVVTGAASGIGRAVVARLLDEGATVVAVDRDEPGLQRLPAAVTPIRADLESVDEVEHVASAAAQLGATHLVNGAGVIEARALGEVDAALWDRLFAVNARAVFLLCQALCPRLPSGGAVVNISSSAAKLATTLEVATYAATKAAVLSITRSFAYAHARRGVRVNAVCPGLIESPMQDRLVAELAASRGAAREELVAARVATVPLGRMGTPEECAEVVAFLLSPRAAYMTGQAINVTGGQITY